MIGHNTSTRHLACLLEYDFRLSAARQRMPRRKHERRNGWVRCQVLRTNGELKHNGNINDREDSKVSTVYAVTAEKTTAKKTTKSISSSTELKITAERQTRITAEK